VNNACGRRIEPREAITLVAAASILLLVALSAEYPAVRHASVRGAS